MHETWRSILEPEFSKPYFSKLRSDLADERSMYSVYPEEADVFSAFRTPFDCVRAVILGQDPYHGAGQAHGLSFSVRPGIPIPAQSLEYLIHRRHLVIRSAHPSPMSASRGFFGSRPFSRANQFLAEAGIGPVDWSIPRDPDCEVAPAPPIVPARIAGIIDLSSL